MTVAWPRLRRLVRRHLLAVAGAGTLFFVPATTGACGEPQVHPQTWLRVHVDLGGRGPLSNAIPAEAVRNGIRQQFKLLDRDGVEGVSAADYDLVEKNQLVRLRAEQVRNFLHFDTDGDGVVTRGEVKQAIVQGYVKPIEFIGHLFRTTGPPTVEQRISDWMAADTNSDGRITYDEMLAPPAARLPMSYWTVLDDRHLLALDGDSNGNVSSQEFDQAVESFMAEIDTDADGSISTPERQIALGKLEPTRKAYESSIERRRRTAAMRRKAWHCGLPEPDKNDHVVLLGTQTGTYPPGFSGRDDGGIVRLEIEPGTEPLYIVATSMTQIAFQVSGATDRVAMFVAMAQNQHSATGDLAVRVEGLASEKIYVPPSLDCLIGMNENAGTVEMAGAELSGLMAGRTPDSAAGFDTLDFVKLPSLSR